MSESRDDSDRGLERGRCQDAASDFMPLASDFAERRRGNVLLKTDTAKCGDQNTFWKPDVSQHGAACSSLRRLVRSMPGS